jgi:hypothetical protein
MFKNYKFSPNTSKTIDLSYCTMSFPYEVIHAVEMDDRVIVNLATNTGKPQPWDVQNIWCYLKPTPSNPAGQFLWKVQPPLRHTGEPHDLPYYALRYWPERNVIYATTLGFGYAIDPDTGASTLIMQGLR